MTPTEAQSLSAIVTATVMMATENDHMRRNALDAACGSLTRTFAGWRFRRVTRATMFGPELVIVPEAAPAKVPPPAVRVR